MLLMRPPVVQQALISVQRNRCVSHGYPPYPELCINTNFVTEIGKSRLTIQQAKSTMYLNQRKPQH